MTVSASAVTAGEQVEAFGTVAADRTELDAGTVAVVGPLAGGKVTGISGATITAQSPRGTIRISTSSSTIFASNGRASSLAAVKKGDFVLALGLQTSTTVTASGVWFGTTAGGAGSPGIGLGLGAPAFGAFPGGIGGQPFGAGGFDRHGSWPAGGFGHPAGSGGGRPASSPTTAGALFGAAAT
jgi:hypothetical protein